MSRLNACRYLPALFTIMGMTGCSECYPTDLQLRAAYERCHDLGSSWSPKLKQPVRTFVCTTPNDDVYADFIVRESGYCRTYQQQY